MCEHQRVHARVTLPRRILSVCCAFVVAVTRPCPRFPALPQDGKEGVDGSSPSEGLDREEIPGNRGFLLSDTAPQSTSALHSRTEASPRAPRKVPANPACCLIPRSTSFEWREAAVGPLGRGAQNRLNKPNPARGSRRSSRRQSGWGQVMGTPLSASPRSRSRRSCRRTGSPSRHPDLARPRLRCRRTGCGVARRLKGIPAEAAAAERPVGGLVLQLA
jgi:hypothetical protein